MHSQSTVRGIGFLIYEMLLISFSLFLLIPTSFSESLVWSDEFDTLDDEIWSHLVTTYPLVRTKGKKSVLLIKMYHVIV